MRSGADKVVARWLALAWLALGLFACGGRTIDDGVYGYEGTSNASQAKSCSYAGKVYGDGSEVPGVCFCFCNSSKIECEPGCSSPSGGASSGGSSSTGGSSIDIGGATAAGTGSGGTSSSGGAAGTISVGGTVSTGGTLSTAGSSSTAGSTSTGGSTGVGGSASCGPPPRGYGMNPLIDDMEDGDSYIYAFEGRSGVWFSYNDATPSAYQLPMPGTFAMTYGAGAVGGRVVAHTDGKGFSSWGAGMGLVLNNGCPYDASVYQGVHFYVRADYTAGSSEIYVLLPTAATTPVANRGTCIEVSPSACYDDYQRPISVGSTWQEEYVPYGALTQQGWGTRVTFDPRTLTGINFQTLYGGGESFSFSIDEISFY